MRLTSAASNCSRRSGEVSIRIICLWVSIRTETRRRRLRGLSGSQAPQLPPGRPIIGTPAEPPQPSTVTRIRPYSSDARPWQTAGKNCRWSPAPLRLVQGPLHLLLCVRCAPAAPARSAGLDAELAPSKERLFPPAADPAADRARSPARLRHS